MSTTVAHFGLLGEVKPYKLDSPCNLLFHATSFYYNFERVKPN